MLRVVRPYAGAVALAIVATSPLAHGAVDPPAAADGKRDADPRRAIVDGEGEPGSPRATATAFLTAARSGDFAEAGRFLDLAKGDAPRAAELARRLDAVLARKLWIEPKELSPWAKGGKEADGKGAAYEELGALLDKKARKIPIRLVRRDGDVEPKWLFSRDVTTHIDEWYEALEDRWIREHVPDALLRPGPKDLLLWQWAAIPLLLTIGLLVGRLFASASRALARPVLLRTAAAWEGPLARRLTGPVSLAVATITVWALSGGLALYEPAQLFLVRLLRAVFFVAFFWGLLRLVAAFAEVAKEASWAKGRRGAIVLSDFGTRAARIAIAAIGAVAVLSELGYPVASLLAGLGVGGIAVALAAQKTMEHLFGSVAILADQPFRVGDVVRVDGVLGTVEAIGLRSTRIRTEDRTVVVWPNGKLADLRVENIAPRDRYRQVFDLHLAPETPVARVEALCARLRAAVVAEESVDGESCLVHVTRISGDAIDVDVTVFAKAPGAAAFLPVRERLWLAFLAAADAERVRLAAALPHPARFPEAPPAEE